MAERRKTGPLVLIATGIAGLRKQWRQALQGLFALHEVSERKWLEHSLVNRRPVALILDLHLPELGGVGSVAMIHNLWPATRIVVLTNRPDEREGIAVLKAGARGYCDRNIDAPLLAKALDVVQKGEIWVGRKLIPHLLEELATLTDRQHEPAAGPADPGGALDRITAREREIAQLLSAGASNKAIAKKLSVTESTVKAHLTAIFRKLGISGRLQLALFVLEHSRPPGSSGGIAMGSNWLHREIGRKA